jgi:excisionase family DNA binding protein
MQAYASADVAMAAEPRPLDLRWAAPGSESKVAPSPFGLDAMLSQLADLVAARVIEKLAPPDNAADDDWLDTRDASDYLGIHRDSLRRLAAEREIPAEQAGAGCKLFFRRSDLDAWRRRASASVIGIRSRHDG